MHDDGCMMHIKKTIKHVMKRIPKENSLISSIRKWTKPNFLITTRTKTV